MLGDASQVYHPGQSGRLCLGPKNVLAEFGALHPKVAKAFDLDGPVVAAEIFLDAIPQKRGQAGHMRSAYAPPPLQAVNRDFAFLVAADLPADQLLRAVRGADKAAIAGASLFDLFTGQGVPEGQKSLAIEVTLQPAGEELHRGGAEGDFGTDRGSRGEARGRAQGLISQSLGILIIANP